VDIAGIRTGRHCTFALHTHLTRTEQILRTVCADVETELVEVNGDNNHIHLLVNSPPTIAIAKLVNSLKGVSSRRMRQEFPDLVLPRRGTVDRPAPVHRAAEPAHLMHARAWGPSRAGPHPRPEERSTGPPNGS